MAQEWDNAMGPPPGFAVETLSGSARGSGRPDHSRVRWENCEVDYDTVKRVGLPRVLGKKAC